MKPIKRYELVELTVPAGAQGKVNFQSIPQLRNQANQIIIIQGIQVFSLADYARSQYNSTVSGIPDAQIPNVVLVLYVNGEESVHMIPITSLINTYAIVAYQQIPIEFADLTNVDFDKSYVQLALANSTGADFVIPFGIKYIRLQRNPSGTFE